MNKKVELVLNALIQSYIKSNKPISSTNLKKEADLPFSESTIRNYLQKLKNIGLVEKDHFSSGSKPSILAMLNFWQNVLPYKYEKVDIDTIKSKCSELDIFAFVKMFDNQMLIEVINVDNRYIVLGFENDEIVFRFDKKLFYFFKSLKGLYLEDIKNIFQKYQVGKIKKIDYLYDYFTFNQKILYNLCNDFDLENLKDIKFDDSIELCKPEALVYKIKASNLSAIFIGSVYSNFVDLTLSLKGGENGKKA